MLRLTPLLALLALPLALNRLILLNRRERPRRALFSPHPEAVVLSLFPLAWFYGFLYYTEVPGLVLVVSTISAASQGDHWLAAFVGSVINISKLH